MPSAPRFVEKLARSLFASPEEQLAFLEALHRPAAGDQALLWLQQRPADFSAELLPPAAWQPEFVDRLPAGHGLGTSALHQQGAFYLLDPSSVFCASVLAAVARPDLLVLDVCAAPGGKSLLAWRMLNPRQLICNETIAKRLPALISNLSRCRVRPVLVTNHDPEYLASAAPGTSDVVIVDAPCSGQSLIVKGKRSPGCFNPVVINSNANRQKRIIANSAMTVAPEGYLAYMTCTYSRDENEGVLEWFLKKFERFQPIEVPCLSAHRSHLTPIPCYRLWPQRGAGAGGFAALLRLAERGPAASLAPGALRVSWRGG